MVYVVITNNGGEYEDYMEFAEGVFSTKEKAIDAGESRSDTSDTFYIGEFEIDGRCISEFVFSRNEDTDEWSEKE